jgi:phosphate transport system ATP-binding protein
MHEEIDGARTEGEVLLDGLDLYDSRIDIVAVRRAVGMVFQKPNPFPTMSVLENVVSGLRLTGASRGEMVEVGQTEKMFTNPDDDRTEQYVTGKFG